MAGGASASADLMAIEPVLRGRQVEIDTEKPGKGSGLVMRLVFGGERS